MGDYRLELPQDLQGYEDLRWIPTHLSFNPLQLAEVIRESADKVRNAWQLGATHNHYSSAKGAIDGVSVQLAVVCIWQDGSTILVVDLDEDLRSRLLPSTEKSRRVEFYVKTYSPRLLHSQLFYPGVMAHVDCGDVFDHGHEDAIMAFSHLKRV